MDKDPVCGMTVSRGEESGSSEYQGKQYYFCSPDCQQRFDRDPQKFAIRRTVEAE